MTRSRKSSNAPLPAPGTLKNRSATPHFSVGQDVRQVLERKGVHPLVARAQHVLDVVEHGLHSLGVAVRVCLEQAAAYPRNRLKSSGRASLPGRNTMLSYVRVDSMP